MTLEIRPGDDAVVLATPAQRESDEQALRQTQAEAAIGEDVVVQALQTRLDARLQQVRPLDAVSLKDGD